MASAVSRDEVDELMVSDEGQLVKRNSSCKSAGRLRGLDPCMMKHSSDSLVSVHFIICSPLPILKLFSLTIYHSIIFIEHLYIIINP